MNLPLILRDRIHILVSAKIENKLIISNTLLTLKGRRENTDPLETR